ncbi:MAG: hypothetical protein A2787_08345 [Omnitrophica WOR_2 bacterium RIFCSPHIGHO2_01_FULL_48_9]|nr:MAG: hypothetical protein A3D10_07975 [Omnitrophica WOR_2 bacterium RIFCSPHIGHO2_02_FULL_48_11]OGX33352.1 MAG: hypothetical protein A2787_08345 [Omnitrophica WOR_2 bacterium RIFCSPHIGHO2_01_FULL_48_9]
MQKKTVTQLQRTIDANFNRAKEGLRVCEDVCRFIYDDPKLTRRYKVIRHRLTEVIAGLKILNIIRSRDIAGDVGKKTIPAELRRQGIGDVFYANSQRVKESVRVLEEFTKLLDTKLAPELKRLRYQLYALEKEIVERR